MTADDIPIPKEGVLFRELDDGCVLYDPDEEKVHSLNVTAGAIWCMVDGERSLGQIADEVSFTMKAPRETVLADVLRLADRFRRQGLIEC